MTGWHAGSLKGHVLTHPLVEKCVKSTGSSWETGKKAVIPGLNRDATLQGNYGNLQC